MEATCKIKVNDEDFTLGRVGMSILVDAAKQIRLEKEKCFYGALAHIGNMDQNSCRLAAMSAFESVLRTVTVGDVEARFWLRSPQGELLMFQKALENGGHVCDEATTRRLYDGMDRKTYDKVDNFLYQGFWDRLVGSSEEVDEAEEAKPAEGA